MKKVEEVEAQGIWFIPGYDERPSFGTLTWGPGCSARVELSGLLEGAPDDEHQGEPIPVVLGHTIESGSFTLCGVHVANRTRNYPHSALSRDTLEAAAVFSGAHVSEGLVRRFPSISFRLNGLTEWWAWEQAVPRHVPLAGNRRGFALEFEHPPDIEIPVDGATIVFRPGVGEEHSGFDVDLSIRATIDIRPSQPLTLDQAGQRYIGPIRDLFCLLTGQASELVTTTAVDPGGKVALRVLSHQLVEEREVKFPDIFASHRDIGSLLPSIVRLWLETPSDKVASRNLFLAWQRARPLYADQQLLLLVSSLEAFHRAYSEPASPAPEHEERVKAILAASPDAHRRWLRGKLRHSHEPTLEDRVREIYSKASVPLQVMAPARRTFARDVAEARNLHIHNDPKRRRERAVDPLWLTAANEVLALIMRERLLMECGIPQDDIMELARWHQSYRIAGQTCARWYEQLRLSTAPESPTGS